MIALLAKVAAEADPNWPQAAMVIATVFAVAYVLGKLFDV